MEPSCWVKKVRLRPEMIQIVFLGLEARRASWWRARGGRSAEAGSGTIGVRVPS